MTYSLLGASKNMTYIRIYMVFFAPAADGDRALDSGLIFDEEIKHILSRFF